MEVGMFQLALLALPMVAMTFDQLSDLPPQWQTGVTGHGAQRWEVVNDESSGAKALRQSGEATFTWAVDTRHKLADGFVQARIKPVSGREDQAGGLIFRFTDENNYYVVRANALEDNVVLYKTVAGKRSPLQVKGRMIGYGVDVRVPSGKWSVLRVEFHADQFQVYFDGTKLFEVEDRTFSEPGFVGLWTKADSVTLFDDFSYGATQR
jgi:hypothetical protein